MYEAYYFVYVIYITLTHLSDKVAAKAGGYGGYRGGGGLGDQPGYGTLTTICIVIGVFVGLCALGGLCCCICDCVDEDVASSFPNPLKDEDLTTEDSKETDVEQNRTCEESQILCKQNDKEINTLEPPSYDDSFAHSSALLENFNTTEDVAVTENSVRETKYEAFLRKKEALDDTRY